MPTIFTIVISLVIVIVGIVFLIWGLLSFKVKRLIENIPTSNIRSIAMGLVEIFGVVVSPKNNLLKSPFSNKDCVYYKYKIEELQSSGKAMHWTTIRKGWDFHFFYLKDNTGMVLVDPRDAKIDIPVDNVFDSTLGKDPPDEVKQFLHSENIAFEGSLFKINKTMKFTEYFIAPGDKLYIIGTAGDNPYVKDASVEKGVEDVMIKKGKFEKFYYISDKHEDAVLNKYKVKMWGGIILGAIFIIVSLLVLTQF